MNLNEYSRRIIELCNAARERDNESDLEVIGFRPIGFARIRVTVKSVIHDDGKMHLYLNRRDTDRLNNRDFWAVYSGNHEFYRFVVEHTHEGPVLAAKRAGEL